MHSHTPQVALLQRPEVTQANVEARQTYRPYQFTCTFYGMDTALSIPPAEGSFTIPFSSVFESLVSCSAKCAQELAKTREAATLREVFGGILGLLNGMVGRLAAPVVLAWEPAVWLGVLLESMEYEVRSLVLSLELNTISYYWFSLPSLPSWIGSST